MPRRELVTCLAVVFYSLLSTAIAQRTDLRTLRLVQAVWRHGDRTPKATYPKASFQDFEEGFSQLTSKGKFQGYRLGEFLRQRYDGFLPRKYNRKDIYIRSSNADRALQTAEALVQGLYPSQESEYPGLPPKQNVPIHSMALMNDAMLKSGKYGCPDMAKKQKKDEDKLDERLSEKYQPMYNFISEQSGVKASPGKVDDLYNVFNYFREHDVPMPGWVNASVWNTIVDTKRTRRFAEFDERFEQRVMSGYMIRDIVKRMKAKANGEEKDIKAYFYSAHDTTLIGLQHAFGINEPYMPWYTTAYVFELHDLGRGNWQVRPYMRNIDRDPPNGRFEAFPISSCSPQPCSLPSFDQSLKPVMVDLAKLHDLCDRECGDSSEELVELGPSTDDD